MTDKKREAGDKTKGFTLQKQRALALFFDEIKINPNVHINVAIEYQGDVFLQSEKTGYVEEQKNYNEISTFSFNSHQILNTLAYFLEIWLAEEKSQKVKFGFYSTTKIAKEKSTKKIKFLDIPIPSNGLLKHVVDKKLAEDGVLESVRKFLVQEYVEQYSKVIESELDDSSLTSFLNSITWYFEQDNEKKYELEIIDKIINSEFAHLLPNTRSSKLLPGYPDIVFADLMYALEKKQDESDILLKFLSKDRVELSFRRIADGEQLNINAVKYLTIDLSEFRIKTEHWLKAHLKAKYFSNVKNKSFPELLIRKVAKHNREVKIKRIDLEQANPEKAKYLEVVIKELGDLINEEAPTFLFGEIGSGKSTLLAHYYLQELKNDVLPIFIPSTFLKGKITRDLQSFKALINEFVNNEINLEDKFFDLDTILFAKNELTLIIDGLDEFDKDEANKLLRHLLNISSSISNLRVIASGRPIELQELVNFNEWNCLTTLDLTEGELRQILTNEAIAVGMDKIEAEGDSSKRFKILSKKQELLSIATTPLIACLIRDFLDENIESKTLGDILYEVVKNRLNWHEEDQKENLKSFLDAYPNALQREPFIAEIGYKLYHSHSGRINEDNLFRIVGSEKLIPKTTNNRNKVVDEAIKFFKSSFLQKIGDEYAFQSHQLHQLTVGIYLFNQIFTGEKFDFKQDRITEWREISYSGTVARIKGESRKMINFFSEVLDELIFTEDNTPATAVFLAEAQINELNILFIEKLRNLGFRPLRLWGESDSIVPNAYSYAIKDIGQKGFEWLFENYLTPRHPSQTGGYDRIGVRILRYYLVRSHYQLSNFEKETLGSIIQFHVAVKAFSCNNLLPVIAVALPEKFESKQRCILLADALKSYSIASKAEEILRKEWSKGNHNDVLNGLETACRNKDYQHKNALRLWLQLNESPIPKLLLNHCIRLISNGDSEIQAVINKRINHTSFISYLRFIALHQNTISDAAAIVLYKIDSERNPTLIAWPIMHRTSWFDYKDAKREEILNDVVLANDEKRKAFILDHIPNSNRDLGIPEIYVKYFLATLESTDDIYINEFLHVVNNLGKYFLSRYPEIRYRFIKILNKEAYYDALKNMLKHLDSTIRYKSASILLACYPEKEKEALEIVIRSSFKRLSDNQEWLRFCMKLNYSKVMLDHIYFLLDDLTEVSRVFAIKLLYHNDEYRLNSNLIDELILGLLGAASFLDWSAVLTDDGVHSVIAQNRFYEDLKKQLTSGNYEIKERAASHLIYHHESKLDVKEKAICWLLHIQYSERSLIDFYKKHIHLFDNSDFISELKTQGKGLEKITKGKKILLLRFYEALKERADWKEFFIALINVKPHMDHHRLEQIYPLLIDLANEDGSVKVLIGKAAKELLTYPTYAEDTHYNFIIPYLAILAQEFENLSSKEVEEILVKYRISQDEIACSLLYRLGKIPDEYYPERGNIEHISLFATNPIVPYSPIKADYLPKILADGEDIPKALIDTIESVLLEGLLNSDEVIKLSTLGNLATYFAMVIAFSRNSDLTLKDFLKAEDIGSGKHYARGITQYYKSVLSRIKEITVSDKKNKEEYINVLINEIGSENKARDIIDIFNELFDLKANFNSILLIELFEALFEVPYRLNLNLVYQINEFFLNRTNSEDKKGLIVPLRKCLKAVLSSGYERHESELELMAWQLSLMLLYLEGKSTEETQRGFLIGLSNVFVQDGNRNYTSESGGKKKFKGRDLFIHSDLIFRRLNRNVISEIIKKGAESDVPEISSLCRLISSVAND